MRPALIRYAQDASKDVKIPLPYSLLIETLSHLQILSLIITPVLSALSQSINPLSQTLYNFLYYFQLFNTVYPFVSLEITQAMICIGIVYTLSLLLCSFYTALKKHPERKLPFVNPSTLTLISIFHSRVIFYFLHSFCVRTISLYANCDSSEDCIKTPWIVVIAFIIIINTLMAFAKEIICHQFSQRKNLSAMKDRIYPVVLLVHKTLLVALIQLSDESEKAIIATNFVFAILNLTILYQRFPYIHNRTLQMSIIVLTITFAFTILLMLYLCGLNLDSNAILVYLLISPLLVKMAFIKLRIELKQILSLKIDNPYKILHFPILVEEVFGKISLYPEPVVFNKSTLYSLGISNGNLEKMREDSQMDALQKQVYSNFAGKILQLLRTNKDNELLLFALADLCSNQLNDMPNALLTINSLRTKDLSFPAKITLDIITAEIEGLYLKPNTTEDDSASFSDYFNIRDATTAFKTKIQKEILLHFNLWDKIKNSPIEGMEVINLAQSINRQSISIKKYWRQNFEGREAPYYAHTFIIYGIYIQAVQALPQLGSFFLKKAHVALQTKLASHQQILNTLGGLSAVIVASIEAEKPGKVIDASSSIESLFKAKKEMLIGSNIAILMPQFIAKKHNAIIQRYSQDLKYDLNKKHRSYGKTLLGEYFQVELTLRLYPFINKGLNVMAYVRKTSKYKPLMVVDQGGYIVELAQNLKSALNLSDKNLVNLHIQELCPEFKPQHRGEDTPPTYREGKRKDSAGFTHRGRSRQVSAALSILQEGGGRKGSDLSNPGNHIIQLQSTQSPVLNPMKKTVSFAFSPRNTAADDSQRGLISQDQFILDGNSDYTKTSPVIAPHKPSSDPKIFEEEQYDFGMICDNADIDKFFYFYPLQGTVPLQYKIQIETQVFEGETFKLFSLTQDSTTPYLNPEKIPEIADEFDHEEDRPHSKIIQAGKPPQCPVTSHVFAKTLKHQTSYTSKEDTLQDFRVDNMKSLESVSGKASSMMQSHTSENIAKITLKNLERAEKPSRALEIITKLVFISIGIIIFSIVFCFFYTKSSIGDMKDAMAIINTVNQRASRAIDMWQSMLFIYLRANGLRPINSRLPVYVNLCQVVAQEMIDNSKETTMQIATIPDSNIVKALNAKLIYFWEPETEQLLNNGPLDSFSASTILTEYNQNSCAFTGSVHDLVGQREPMFAMNNTVNDYLMTLEEAVDDVSQFLLDTKVKNENILKAFISIENLSMAFPFMLIASFCWILLRSYTNLFRAISKIKEESILKRIKEIEYIRNFFEENIEDDLHKLNNYEHEKFLKAEKANNQDSAKTYRASKSYKLNLLYFHAFQHLFVILGLTVLVITFLTLSYSLSVKTFHNLGFLQTKVLKVYDLYRKVEMVQSSFNFYATFKNYTGYKILHKDPLKQAQKFANYLNDASDLLLTIVNENSSELSEDSIVDEILYKNACKYVEEDQQANCLVSTNQNSFALLGLNHKFYQIVEPLVLAFNDTITFAQTYAAMDKVSAAIGENHFVLYASYQALAHHYVDQFDSTIDTSVKNKLHKFLLNLGLALACIAWMRIVVLARFKILDINMKTILRIIPKRIFEENKIIKHYLGPGFRKELEIIDGLN